MAGYTCHSSSCSFSGTLLQVVQHNRKVHVSDKRDATSCCICSGRVYSCNLRRHIRSCHPNDCTVQCHVCREPFVEDGDMRRHVNSGCRKSGKAMPSYIIGESKKSKKRGRVTTATAPSIPADFKTFLDCCRPDDVNKYISQQLQTDETYRKECSNVVDRVDTFFKGKKGFTLKRFIKGGSLGKGTAVTSKSDIDCVMFTSNLPSIDSPYYEDNLKTVLKSVEDQLKRSSIFYNLEVLGRTSYAVKLRVKARKADHASHDLDLLLAPDLLEEYTTRDEVYTMMGKLSNSDRQYCSAALVELQRDFVKKQRAEVKALIRLVKMWKASCVTETSLTSYPLELLCIHIWPSHETVAAAFKAVLQKLSNYSSICAYWTDNYSFSRVQPMLGTRGPLILDPANPYNNVADRCRDWSAVARAAQETLRKPFFSRY